MTVYDNMAFGLKLRKIAQGRDRPAGARGRRHARPGGVPRAQAEGPVRRAAAAGGDGPGDRPRAAGLPDGRAALEPRRQAPGADAGGDRAGSSASCSVTTIYVTHDQVEAMTMGDRVAVIRKGMLQQVDTPQTLYDHPVNLFVAGFIGSPAMNMVEATVDRPDGVVSVRVRRAAPAGVTTPPGGASRGPERVRGQAASVVGIRPEDMEDASLVVRGPDGPADHRHGRSPGVARARWSSSTSRSTRRHGAHRGHEGARARRGAEALESRARAGRGGRLDVRRRSWTRRTGVRRDEPMELVVDTARLHFFDPETGAGIYED